MLEEDPDEGAAAVDELDLVQEVAVSLLRVLGDHAGVHGLEGRVPVDVPDHARGQDGPQDRGGLRRVAEDLPKECVMRLGRGDPGRTAVRDAAGSLVGPVARRVVRRVAGIPGRHAAVIGGRADAGKRGTGRIRTIDREADSLPAPRAPRATRARDGRAATRCTPDTRPPCARAAPRCAAPAPRDPRARWSTRGCSAPSRTPP
jgi:hypothetical protein